MLNSLGNQLFSSQGYTSTLFGQGQPQRRSSLPLRLPRCFGSVTTMAFNPGTQPQKTIILNEHGEKLVGLLHDTGSKEVVILCHGFRSSKEQHIMLNTSVALEREGISAFRFDFPGNGKHSDKIYFMSAGTPARHPWLSKMKESDGSFAYGNYMREVEDFVKYFNGAQRLVHAIVGHSKGGGIVLLYSSKYHDVRTVVNISGRYDLKTGVAERLGEDFMEKIKKDGYIGVKCKKTGNTMYRVTEESLMDRLNTDMHEACLKIDSECRVLTVHGSADEVIPVEDAYELSKIIPNHKLHIIEGANHSYTKHQDELVPVIVNFIKDCLELQQDKEASC